MNMNLITIIKLLIDLPYAIIRRPFYKNPGEIKMLFEETETLLKGKGAR